LRERGHDVLAPELPFADPETTYRERAQHALDALAGREGPVVVVGHSLGAGYAPIVASERPATSLAYICPAPVGPFARTSAPMPSTREGFSFPPNRPDGTSVWEPEAARTAIYSRLPETAARELAARLKPGASPKDAYPLSAPPQVPTAFAYARFDEFFAPAWSRWVARDAGLQPVELKTGHFPMIEAPDTLAQVLEAAAP
jgi:pimeloyl-ACP methyl ester carboxylesterase